MLRKVQEGEKCENKNLFFFSTEKREGEKLSRLSGKKGGERNEDFLVFLHFEMCCEFFFPVRGKLDRKRSSETPKLGRNLRRRFSLRQSFENLVPRGETGCVVGIVVGGPDQK